MQEFMDWYIKHRKNHQPENCVKKNVPERVISAYVDPYRDCQAKKNYADRPEKEHQSGPSSYVIEDEASQVIVWNFKYLPVFSLILEIFNL